MDKLKILIVDDEVMAIRYCREMLGDGGDLFEVIGEITIASQVPDFVRKNRPDIVLLDINMPCINGLDLANIIKSIDNQIRIFILTAYKDFDYAQKALNSGMDAYIVKFEIEPQKLREQLLEVAKSLEYERAYSSNTPALVERLQYLEGKLKNGEDISNPLFSEILANEPSFSDPTRQAIAYIQENYAADITIEHIAEYVFLSTGYLRKRFKDDTGKTINDYLTEYRIKEAMRIIDEGYNKLYGIYELVGFSSSQYFSTVFKKVVGISPSEYSKIHRR